MEIQKAGLRERLDVALGGAYTLEREIGRGGMAAVYLAQDRKHARRVAVKVLHPELAGAVGPERFLQEVRLLAVLQHPHILGLLDSGVVADDAGVLRGRPFYVMPYVDGESLRQRLAREGPLPVADAVRLAAEVAGALDYAHRHGVVHRDVKPENILLHDGSALVADFGIALAVEQAGGARLTQTGLALGTPQYMAPEQAAGERQVDARADVYALGVVTYEMLAGEPPFTGPTAQAVVARVLTEAPRRLAAQRPSVPPHVAAAVHRALAPLPADRFATAGEFTRALQGDASVGAVDAPARAIGRDVRTRALVGALALVAVASTGLAVWGWLRPHRAPALPGVTAAILPPRGEAFRIGSLSLALSPDGTQLAFVVQRAAPRPRLLVRHLATGEVRELPGTQNAVAPFWSPDGREIGFSADGKLRTTPAAGGPVTVVCDLPTGMGGAAWARDGTILFAGEPGGVVFRVPHTGGTPVAVTHRGPEPPHVQPVLLPDGRHFLYGSLGGGGVFVGDLRTGFGRMILRDATRATYVAPGYLLYDVGDRLLARRYDAQHDTVVGEPVTVAEGLLRVAATTTHAASPTGVLVYQQGSLDSGRIVVDRHGAVVDSLPLDAAEPFAVSHDGTRVAQGPWVRDLRREAPLKLPLSLVFTTSVAWSPDDARLAFTGLRDNSRRAVIVVRGADALGDELRLDGPPGQAGSVQVADWTRDGSALLVTGAADSASASGALWLVDVATGMRRRWLTVAGRIDRARLSPDGRWVAYQSDETGAPEVYVRPFPGAGAPVRVSVAGGAFPAWRGDGRELFYVTPGGELMMVAVTVGASFDLAAPRLLVRGLLRPASTRDVTLATYAPMPDGQRFLVRDTRRGDPPLTLVAPWTAPLRTSTP